LPVGSSKARLLAGLSLAFGQLLFGKLGLKSIGDMLFEKQKRG